MVDGNSFQRIFFQFRFIVVRGTTGDNAGQGMIMTLGGNNDDDNNIRRRTFGVIS